MSRPHDHDQVDRPDLPEPDPFHDEEGNPTVESVEGLAEFGAACWDAGVDPDEMGEYLRSVGAGRPAD